MALHTLQESVSYYFTCLNRSRKSGTAYAGPGTKLFYICGLSMCQIHMSSDSVIRNQLLYQLCTGELLWHWHFHYWCLNVLGVGCGLTVADTSCLWDHSFDSYSLTALHRAEGKLLLLILSFEFQKQQPAGRKKKETNSILKIFCVKTYCLGGLFPMVCNNFHCSPWPCVL